MCQDVVMTEVVRPWRGVSAEDRRAERRSKLLEACLDLIGEGGVAAVTAEAVAARAELSKRYFYESFSDRDALLVAASDGVFAAVEEALQEQLSGLSDEPEGRIRGTVSTLVKALTRDARGARLYMESAQHPALEGRRLAAYEQFARLLDDSLLGGRAQQGPHGHAVSLLLVAGTTEVLSRWLAGDLDLDEDAVVRTISEVGIAAVRSLP